MNLNATSRPRNVRGLLTGFALLAVLALSVLAYGGRDADAQAAARPP